MSEKHETHAHHGHAAHAAHTADPPKAVEPAPADKADAHKARFKHACQCIANEIVTLKAAGCTQAEAAALAVQLWEKTKAG